MSDQENSFISIEIPVQWGDMDAIRHVNNTVYLRWVESARIAMFEKMNKGRADFGGIFPILAWQDCKYIFSVTFPDTVVISLDVVRLEPQKIHCEVKIHSKRYDKIASISKCQLVPFETQNQQKTTLPESWKKTFADFYGPSILSQ